MISRVAYRQTLPPISLLIMVAGVGPLAMNITLPATTEMMQELGATYGVTQLTLTLFLVSTAVSQFFLSSLSDIYGRRPLMLAGFVVFAIGSLVCALAPDIYIMLFGRIIQGLSGSVGIGLSRVIVRDVYDRDKSASLIGYITMAMVITPMLGPVTGGLLTQYLSWRFIFWLCLLIACVLLAFIYFFLHETRKPREQGVEHTAMGGSVVLLFREQAFVGYTLLISLASGMYFAFLGGAPFIFTELMLIPPSEMGLYLMLNAVDYASGNFLSGRF